MLYQYWLMLGVGAILFTILSFLKREHIEPIGKVFFMLSGAICWLLFALGLLSIKVVWDHGTMMNYTFMPVNGQEALMLVPASFGILMLLMSYYHAIEIFAYEPLMKAANDLES